MLKKELEKKCFQLEKRCFQLEGIIKDTWWMSRRYAHGRSSTAVSTYNNAIKLVQELGIHIYPDLDGLIKAKDGMFDKEWFVVKKNKD